MLVSQVMVGQHETLINITPRNMSSLEKSIEHKPVTPVDQHFTICNHTLRTESDRESSYLGYQLSDDNTPTFHSKLKSKFVPRMKGKKNRTKASAGATLSSRHVQTQSERRGSTISSRGKQDKEAGKSRKTTPGHGEQRLANINIQPMLLSKNVDNGDSAN